MITKIKKQVLHFPFWAIFTALTACSGLTQDSKGSDSSEKPVQHSAIPGPDSTVLPKPVLTQIYTKAIGEYIRAVYKKDNIVFDTLYFGKHVYGQPDDFPDIELPETIENTQIRLVDPETGTKLQQARKERVYINMIGWVDRQRVEFILVTFSEGGKHKFDAFINYHFNTTSQEFELGDVNFKEFSPMKKGK